MQSEMTTINENIENLEDRLNDHDSRLDDLEYYSVEDIESRVTELEQYSIADIDNNVALLEQQVAELDDKVADLLFLVAALESRPVRRSFFRKGVK